MGNGRLKLDIQMFADGEDTTVEELLAAIGELKKTTVPKEDFEKVTESNKKLIKELAENRATVVEGEVIKEKPQQVIDRIDARLETAIHAEDSLSMFKNLIENHEEMKKMGLSVSNVNDSVVEEIKKYIDSSEGNPARFKALMDTIKNR